MSIEKELLSSASRFNNVVNSSPDGIVVTNSSAVILFVNPAAEVMFGLGSVKLLGKPFHYSDLSKDTVEIEVLQANRAPLIAEMRLVDIEWEGEPAMLATLRDVTERIQMNQDLTQSNKELEEFAAVLSHDIRAPLRNIDLLAGWLQKDHAANLDAEAQEDINLIKTTANRMQHMIDDLLHYSRVSARQRMLEDVSLNEVMCDALDQLSQVIFDSGANIECCDLPMIDCNPRQMKILFVHLIENSILYCESKPHIYINAQRKNHSWVIRFQDNGIGVKVELQEKIFQPFDHFRSDSDKHGIGIGLATCKKIAKIHNGEIWLESHAEQGSTVFVKLPEKTVLLVDKAIHN